MKSRMFANLEQTENSNTICIQLIRMSCGSSLLVSDDSSRMFYAIWSIAVSLLKIVAIIQLLLISQRRYFQKIRSIVKTRL